MVLKIDKLNKNMKKQKKFTGSPGKLLIWAIFLWPIAVFYYYSKME